MSKVITFSRQFPAYHPKAGQPTYFVEKFIKSIGLKYLLYDEEREFNPRLSLDEFEPKHHTIRAGHRFKAGDYFSPRVWSGKPYRSKQIVIAPDIEIKKVWDIKFDVHVVEDRGVWAFWINNEMLSHDEEVTLGKNDGLNFIDLIDWFREAPRQSDLDEPHFEGQVISWNENINY